MTPRLLILGAAGFVGQRIVARTVARHGPQAVVAAVRKPAAAGTFPEGVTQRPYDATQNIAPLVLETGATHVVNCVMGSTDAMIQSTRQAVAAMAGNDVRLVHFSSIAVFAGAQGVVQEGDRTFSPADSYGAAKVEAEQMVLSADPARWTILRPGLVHGPGSELWTRRIAGLIADGRLGPMGARGEGICPLVDVDDVAAAALAACETEAATGRALFLVAEDPPTWNRYITDMAAAMGVPARPLSLVRLMVERLKAYPQTFASRLGQDWGEAITPGLVRLFDQQTRFPSSAAPLLLSGWKDYADAVREGARWAVAEMPRRKS